MKIRPKDKIFDNQTVASKLAVATKPNPVNKQDYFDIALSEWLLNELRNKKYHFDENSVTDFLDTADYWATKIEDEMDNWARGSKSLKKLSEFNQTLMAELPDQVLNLSNRLQQERQGLENFKDKVTRVFLIKKLMYKDYRQ